jgi:hypothetical protein
MSEPQPHSQEAEQEPAAVPYLRLPVPLVATGLFAFVAALLALGLWANANLRQPREIVAQTPLPATAVVVAAAPTVVVAAAPTDTAVPTATAVPVALPTATPVRTAVPAATAYVPTPLVIVLDATATPVPVGSETATALPTVEPTLAAEVGQAYENFWRVTSQALLELDDSHLTEVMDGVYLASVRQRIDELRSEGRAIKTHVILNYSVIQASRESATVVDDFEDDSVYVKLGTDEPLSEPTSDQVRTLYKLQYSSGIWKVVDSVSSE